MHVYYEVTLRSMSADAMSAQCGTGLAAWLGFLFIFFPSSFVPSPCRHEERLGPRCSGIGRGILIKT